MRRREAGIETMRIILLVMVIALHVVAPFRMVRFDKFEPNWIFTDTVASLSRICTNCFVLISGFFFMSFKNKQPARTVLRLILPVMVYLPFYLFLELDRSFSEAVRRVFLGALTNSYNLYHLWFVQTFLVLSLIAPLLAAALEQIDQRTHRAVMRVLLAVASVMPSFTSLTGLMWFDLSLFRAQLTLFTALFVTGAYIRKYPPRISPAKAGLMFMAAQIMIILGSRLYNSRYNLASLIQLLGGAIGSLEEAARIETNGLNVTFGDPSNIIIVASSVLFLILFTKLNIRSGATTKMARHVYGAYIIHVFWIQVFSRLGGNRFDLFSQARHESGFYPLFIIVFILAVLVFSLLTDALYGFAYKSLLRFVKARVS
ncbi:MAG: acyltransferase family protein [Defluviitaleaceae bacterium]|nr:acyltransferase family protein [Defluviitaleaceae bacterium]MCL2836068.1 acyltransferase family protein [Defluviitaleaceae bacterium]